MRRNWINLLVAIATATTTLGVAVSGIILRYGLPRGGGRRQGRGGPAFWGWSRHDWCDVHFWLAAITIGLILLHVALHWNWLRTMCRQLRRSNSTSNAVQHAAVDTQA